MVSENETHQLPYRKKMSLPRMIFLFLFSLILSVCCLIYSSQHIYDLLIAMLYNQPALIFSKNLTGMFGGGIFAFSHSFRILALKEKAAQLDKYFITISLLSFFLMFIFPSMMASEVESYVKEHQYGYCAGASSSGSSRGLYCYTVDENTCLIETAKREKILKDFWGE